MTYGADRTEVPVQILAGASQSAEVVVNAGRIVGIAMPAGWDAASITFLAKTRQPAGLPAAPVYGKVQDAGGTEVTITTPAADTYVAIPDTAALLGLGRVKVRSGTAGAPVNQTAQRDFFLIVEQR